MEGIAAVALLIALLTYFEMNWPERMSGRPSGKPSAGRWAAPTCWSRRFLRRFWSRSGSIRPRGKPRRPSAAFAGPVTWIWLRPRRTWTNFESAISHGKGRHGFVPLPFSSGAAIAPGVNSSSTVMPRVWPSGRPGPGWGRICCSSMALMVWRETPQALAAPPGTGPGLSAGRGSGCPRLTPQLVPVPGQRPGEEVGGHYQGDQGEELPPPSPRNTRVQKLGTLPSP